ncbi:MAG: hypothetical protein AAF409_02955 [Pseudomonadota bacterium]
MDTIKPDKGPDQEVCAGFWVRTAEAEHRVLELTANGFVIAAEAPPHLRGFAEILHGRLPIRHGLIVCCWSEQGRVGYEFKRTSPTQPVFADYAPGQSGHMSV